MRIYLKTGTTIHSYPTSSVRTQLQNQAGDPPKQVVGLTVTINDHGEVTTIHHLFVLDKEGKIRRYPLHILNNTVVAVRMPYDEADPINNGHDQFQAPAHLDETPQGVPRDPIIFSMEEKENIVSKITTYCRNSAKNHIPLLQKLLSIGCLTSNNVEALAIHPKPADFVSALVVLVRLNIISPSIVTGQHRMRFSYSKVIYDTITASPHCMGLAKIAGMLMDCSLLSIINFNKLIPIIEKKEVSPEMLGEALSILGADIDDDGQAHFTGLLTQANFDVFVNHPHPMPTLFAFRFLKKKGELNQINFDRMMRSSNPYSYVVASNRLLTSSKNISAYTNIILAHENPNALLNAIKECERENYLTQNIVDILNQSTDLDATTRNILLLKKAGISSKTVTPSLTKIAEILTELLQRGFTLQNAPSPETPDDITQSAGILAILTRRNALSQDTWKTLSNVGLKIAHATDAIAATITDTLLNLLKKYEDSAPRTLYNYRTSSANATWNAFIETLGDFEPLKNIEVIATILERLFSLEPHHANALRRQSDFIIALRQNKHIYQYIHNNLLSTCANFHSSDVYRFATPSANAAAFFLSLTNHPLEPHHSLFEFINDIFELRLVGVSISTLCNIKLRNSSERETQIIELGNFLATLTPDQLQRFLQSLVRWEQDEFFQNQGIIKHLLMSSLKDKIDYLHKIVAFIFDTALTSTYENLIMKEEILKTIDETTPLNQRIEPYRREVLRIRQAFTNITRRNAFNINLLVRFTGPHTTLVYRIAAQCTNYPENRDNRARGNRDKRCVLQAATAYLNAIIDIYNRMTGSDKNYNDTFAAYTASKTTYPLYSHKEYTGLFAAKTSKTKQLIDEVDAISAKIPSTAPAQTQLHR